MCLREREQIVSHGKLQRGGQLFSYPVHHSELLFRGELRIALYLWLALYILAVRYTIRLQLHYIVVAIDGNFCQEYL